jgi:hypothetical protein
VRSDSDSDYTYLGVAPTGSSESAEVWTVTRVQVLADGSAVTAAAAGIAWDDHLTATYS